MKYQALYDTIVAKAGRTLVVRISDNVIPFDGWLVSPSGFWPTTDMDNFDGAVKDIVKWATKNKFEYLGFRYDGQYIWYGVGIVFAHERKEYAMGYAHGLGIAGPIDVGTGKVVNRR